MVFVKVFSRSVNPLYLCILKLNYYVIESEKVSDSTGLTTFYTIGIDSHGGLEEGFCKHDDFRND